MGKAVYILLYDVPNYECLVHTFNVYRRFCHKYALGVAPKIFFSGEHDPFLQIEED